MRRRVGKSELILRFPDGKPGIYCLGKQAPGGLQALPGGLRIAPAGLFDHQL